MMLQQLLLEMEDVAAGDQQTQVVVGGQTAGPAIDGPTGLTACGRPDDLGHLEGQLHLPVRQ